MKCRRCETPVTEDMIRCPKCGGLLPHFKKSEKLNSLKPSKFDIFLIDIGKDREKLVNLLNRILGVKKRKIDKDLKRLPLCLFRGISSENAHKLKLRIESFGASVKIQESKEVDSKRKVVNGFWNKNKKLIKTGAILFLAVIILSLVFMVGSRKYIPAIYKSKDGLKLSQKTPRYNETKGFTFQTEDEQKISSNYSIIGVDIIDSEAEARLALKIEVDEGILENGAFNLIKKLGDDQKKKSGFKYFKEPQEVEVLLYNRDDERRFGGNAWWYKYSWRQGSLGKIISQNIKKINSYQYSKFNYRRFAYYLDEKFSSKSEINPEIKIFPSEFKDAGVQVGIFENDLKIDKKVYLPEIARGVGSVLEELNMKCEGIFVELPTGNYFIPPDLGKLSYTKWGDNSRNEEFLEFVWRNIQKDEKK